MRWLAARLGAAAAAGATFQAVLAGAAARIGTAQARAVSESARAWAQRSGAATALDRPRQPDHWPFGIGEEPETLYVRNAGVVLVAPFLGTLFARLELTAAGAFVDPGAAERGVHLLQVLVDGREGVPEHELTLNKLLCGLPLDAVIGRDFEATARERETAEGLLAAIIRQWSILGRTSIGGLRETFLQREGALTDLGESWRLTVQPGPVDMLLDRIPWSFTPVKLSWMENPLHVAWR